MPPQDRGRSESWLSALVPTDQKVCDSPVDASIRKAIRNDLLVHTQATTRSATWSFCEPQFREHLLSSVRREVLAKFPSLFLDAFERKFREIFTYELTNFRKASAQTLREHIEKEVPDFLSSLLDQKRSFTTKWQAEDECVQILLAHHTATCPSWLINVFEVRRWARESFQKALSEQSRSVVHVLRRFADKWLKNYYEEQISGVEESQEERNPNFDELLERGRRMLSFSFSPLLIGEVSVRDVLRDAYEAALRRRPSQYLKRLIEHAYFEKKPQCPYPGAVEACEAAFYKRFPGSDFPGLRKTIQEGFVTIKKERERQLHLSLQTTVEEYLSGATLLQESASKKTLDEELDELVLEAFPDVPLPEERVRELVFSFYIARKAKEWNQQCRSFFEKDTLYPFVFPDKKEELHQRLYTRFLDSLSQNIACDFDLQDPRSEEWWPLILKQAHDAFNECIRQAARARR